MHTLRIRWAVVFMSIWLTVGTAHAQAPSAAAQQEIEQLFTALQQSQCEFQRNGSWYDSTKAAAHLQQKYDYLLKKELVPTTAAFIERAGSQSSMSGKAYQVRCPGQTAVNSADWLKAQLRKR